MLHYQELLFVSEIILVLIKQESLLTKSIIGRALKKMFKPMSRAMTFVYHLKRLDISPIIICRPC